MVCVNQYIFQMVHLNQLHLTPNGITPMGQDARCGIKEIMDGTIGYTTKWFETWITITWFSNMLQQPMSKFQLIHL